MALTEKLNEMNNKQRILAIGILIIVMVALFFYFPYQNNRKVIKGLETKLSAIQGELQSLRAIHAKLPEFVAQTKRLQTQLLDIRKKLPQERDIPGLLDSISKAGLESGLQFDLFRPRPEIKKEFYAEVPVDITIKGPFHNIAMFIDKIVHLPRIVNVSNISFGNPKEEDGYVFITGTGMATTYRYEEKS